MKTKKYIGWARVSSREQEREGFSLEVQVDAFHTWVERNGGVVDPIFSVSETASKSQQRRVYREMISFAKKHAKEYSGILFYKIDRGTRNLKDMVELEDLEANHNLSFISITEPSENTPAGRLMRRQLATIASFTTERQSVDVKEGINRRVVEGWFPSNPPYGYGTERYDKRSYVETHKVNAAKVRRIFDLRANHGLTVPEIGDRMFEEGLFYSDSKPRFTESKLNAILHDQSYLGFIKFRGAWHKGKHEALIDQVTWDLVRLSFNEQKYRSHEMVYASRLIRCGHCGHIITGEEKFKQTKQGTKSYVYYRCSKYWTANHPRIRLTEAEFDQQVEAAMKPLENICSGTRSMIESVAAAILQVNLQDKECQVSDTKRLISGLESQRDGLINLNVTGRISDQAFDKKMAEFAEQEKNLRGRLAEHERISNRRKELIEGSSKVFGRVLNEWHSLERRTKQLVLSSLFGGFRLEDRTLVPENRTPLELFRE